MKETNNVTLFYILKTLVSKKVKISEPQKPKCTKNKYAIDLMTSLKNKIKEFFTSKLLMNNNLIGHYFPGMT